MKHANLYHPSEILIVSCLSAAIGLVACQQESSTEKTGQKIDKAVDNVGQMTKQTTEQAGQTVDSEKESLAQQAEKANAYIDDAVDTANGELEKARQAIDNAINHTRKQLTGVKQEVVDAAVTSGELIDDSLITTQIKALLLNDDVLKASAIEVTTMDGGVVILKGTVDSVQSLARAIGLANSQKGVKSVQNELTINSAVVTNKP